jgi:hypothetical protein
MAPLAKVGPFFLCAITAAKVCLSAIAAALSKRNSSVFSQQEGHFHPLKTAGPLSRHDKTHDGMPEKAGTGFAWMDGTSVLVCPLRDFFDTSIGSP